MSAQWAGAYYDAPDELLRPGTRCEFRRIVSGLRGRGVSSDGAPREEWLAGSIVGEPYTYASDQNRFVQVWDGTEMWVVLTSDVRIKSPGVARVCGQCGERFYVHPVIAEDSEAGRYCDAHTAQTMIASAA